MDRPRLLLVPMLTEIEWVIKPLLEEWADVASYDAPGVGDEPQVDDAGSSATGRRGLEEVDRRGWDRFVVVADEFGLVAASYVAAEAGSRLQGIALGHARVSNAVEGAGAALDQEVLLGIQSLLRTDPRTFVRRLFKMTGGEDFEGGYNEAMRMSSCAACAWRSRSRSTKRESPRARSGADRLLSLDVPMLLAQPGAASCSPSRASRTRSRRSRTRPSSAARRS